VRPSMRIAARAAFGWVHSDYFDYTQAPLAFQNIVAPLSAKHFLDFTTPPTDPDDD
jgi:hypothetical protein